ncbi:hypothetical protein QX201_010808 [Fusarium graminearum]|uniref:Uncharacterized protein n=1 Tax=Gibberella zeae TaxID=5518 RepID=A0A9N8NGV4_GIBZA|nr:unnamed protein product [Fusarium graminearum]CAG1974592.1 unnamed protein product [Fusarium graminearum]
MILSGCLLLCCNASRPIVLQSIEARDTHPYSTLSLLKCSDEAQTPPLDHDQVPRMKSATCLESGIYWRKLRQNLSQVFMPRARSLSSSISVHRSALLRRFCPSCPLSELWPMLCQTSPLILLSGFITTGRMSAHATTVLCPSAAIIDLCASSTSHRTGALFVPVVIKECCARFHVNHGMQECISAFISTYEVMINHCRTTSSNRTCITSVIQAQELSAQRGILALFYRVLAGETHTAAEVEGNLEAVVPVRVLGAGSIRRGATQAAPGSNNAAADNRSEEREEREEE